VFIVVGPNLTCKFCKGRHHVLICDKASKDSHTSSSKVAQQATTNATPLDPDATSWVGNTSSGTKVALQTALAKVNDKKKKQGQRVV